MNTYSLVTLIGDNESPEQRGWIFIVSSHTKLIVERKNALKDELAGLRMS